MVGHYRDSQRLAGVLRIDEKEIAMTDEERATLMSKLQARLEEVKKLSKKEAQESLSKEGFRQDSDGLLVWGQQVKRA
jgi:chlorite dismutase